MAEKKEIPEKTTAKKATVKKVVKKVVDKKVVDKKPTVKKEASPKVVEKKDEPKKPLSIQLIFQAPDLPTPKVNPRSGKLAEEETSEAPARSAQTRSASTRTRQRTRPEGEAKPKTNEEPLEEKDSGSTRVAAKRQRRKDSRDTGRRRTAVTESEFLARRESVDRRMVVR